MKPRDALTDSELDDLILQEDLELAEFDWFADHLIRPEEESARWRGI